MDFFPIKPQAVAAGIPNPFDAARMAGATVLVIAIPFPLIEPHEPQALTNHGRSLRRLAIEGGLGPDAVLAILDDRPYEPIHYPDAHRQLNLRMIQYYASLPHPYKESDSRSVAGVTADET